MMVWIVIAGWAVASSLIWLSVRGDADGGYSQDDTWGRWPWRPSPRLLPVWRHEERMRAVGERDALAIARNIVNQLFDEAEVPVATRQEVNDSCDSFVASLIAPFADENRRLRAALLEIVVTGCKATEGGYAHMLVTIAREALAEVDSEAGDA